MAFLLSAETYTVDLKLFRKLGLKTFKTDNAQEIFLGEYKLRDFEKATIRVFVTCWPAQFWKFQVETDEDLKFEIKTGSGALSDYWESVLKVAQGMFVVNHVNIKP